MCRQLANSVLPVPPDDSNVVACCRQNNIFKAITDIANLIHSSEQKAEVGRDFGTVDISFYSNGEPIIIEGSVCCAGSKEIHADQRDGAFRRRHESQHVHEISATLSYLGNIRNVGGANQLGDRYCSTRRLATQTNHASRIFDVYVA